MSSSSTRKTFPAGLFLLEHLNLDVLSKPAVKGFYYALGCVHDKSRSTAQSMHANAGNLCQFHLGEAKVSQAWRGTIELVYTQDALEQTTKALKKWRELGAKSLDCTSNGVRVVGPHDNEFLIRKGTDEELKSLQDKKWGVRKQSVGSTVAGIAAVTVRVAVGTAQGIAEFYNDVFKFKAKVGSRNGAVYATIKTYVGQKITFLETKNVDVDDDFGEHLAIYIGDFEGVVKRAADRKILWVNPRFVENVMSLEDARKEQACRFRDIVSKSGRKLLRLEHEVRSLYWHGNAMNVDSFPAIATSE